MGDKMLSKIVDYIKETLQKGFSEEDIRTALKQNGWSDEDIENAFKEAKTPEKPGNVPEEYIKETPEDVLKPLDLSLPFKTTAPPQSEVQASSAQPSKAAPEVKAAQPSSLPKKELPAEKKPKVQTPVTLPQKTEEKPPQPQKTKAPQAEPAPQLPKKEETPTQPTAAPIPKPAAPQPIPQAEKKVPPEHLLAKAKEEAHNTLVIGIAILAALVLIAVVLFLARFVFHLF